jgi:hypothetical protein
MDMVRGVFQMAVTIKSPVQTDAEKDALTLNTMDSARKLEMANQVNCRLRREKHLVFSCGFLMLLNPMTSQLDIEVEEFGQVDDFTITLHTASDHFMPIITVFEARGDRWIKRVYTDTMKFIEGEVIMDERHFNMRNVVDIYCGETEKLPGFTAKRHLIRDVRQVSSLVLGLQRTQYDTF